MGLFRSLETEQYDRQYTDGQLVKRMAGYFQPHIKPFIIVTFLALVMAVLGALTPLIVSRGVDALAENAGSTLIALMVAAVFAASVMIWLSNWIRRRLTIRMVAGVELQLREDAFRAAAQHDLAFYDEMSSGKVVSRITSDTKEFGQVVVMVSDIFSQLIQAIILLFIMFSISWQMALILVVFIPIVYLTSIGFRVLARFVTRDGMRAMATVNSTIKETISGISVAKNFRQEEAIYADFEDANLQSYRVNVRKGLALSVIFPSLNILSGLATAILVYAGGISAAAGIFSVGSWFLFIQSLDRFFFPVLNLSAFWPQVQAGLSAAERVFALIDAEPAVNQHVPPVEQVKLLPLRGEIVFDAVNFQYSNRQQVLEDFSLNVRPGETIALVGHTGAGKSSIAKLVARFYEFQGGRILIDGHDIRSLHLPTYRSQLGIVSQQPFLFSGTVAENICYACPSDSEMAFMENIASQIGNGEWLETLPERLNTMVGERGGRLSMGQRQLVSLMRVLVQKPSIFILDEATASVDPFTEWQIQQALKMILSRTTSILIAHRLSTVKSADRIIVLDHGHIIEEGSHQGLLAVGGHYAELYETYFRHQSLAYVENARNLVAAAGAG